MINHDLNEGDSSLTSTITLERYGREPINISRIVVRVSIYRPATSPL